MSKTDIIMLAWFSPVLICVAAIPPALVILFCQRAFPVLHRKALVLWAHYPRWWRYLP